jgi:predicted GH43/DUF377 family glycosyl hydrolase
MNKKNSVVILLLMVFFSCSKSSINSEYAGIINNPLYASVLAESYNSAVIQDDNGIYLRYTYMSDITSIGISESADGSSWSEPTVCIEFHATLSWATDLKAPTICKMDDLYYMWFAGHYDNGSWIGFAISIDAREWVQVHSTYPEIYPDLDWEKDGVTSPVVIWDASDRKFKMWYGAGATKYIQSELDNPVVIGYAESPDGFKWEKQMQPVFLPNTNNKWEEQRVVPYLVIRNDTQYILFYKGYDKENNPKIGVAVSDDGISNWIRNDEPLKIKRSK